MLLDLRGFWPVRRLGALKGGAGAARAVLAETDSLGISAHSFLYQATAAAPDGGNLPAYWSGPIFTHYAGFSSAADRWAANGPDRTGAYSDALVITEIGDLSTGLAEPNSPEGAASYQAFFNFGVAARAKGCKLMLIYPPHSPEGADLDQDTLRKLWRLVLWLRGRPEIDGLGVYLLPAPLLVRAAITRAAPASIYADGLHLRGSVYPSPGNRTNDALAQMIRMALTGARPTLAGQPIAPRLNDPGAVATALTVTSVDAASLSYTTAGGNAAFALPIPPAGSTVEFDITCASTTYFRLDSDTDMTTPGYTELVAGGIPAGTRHISVTVPSYTDRNFIGWRTPNTNGQAVLISNWRVWRPWDAEMLALVDTAWQLVQDYACTGLGGTIQIEPWPITGDPLPEPVMPA